MLVKIDCDEKYPNYYLYDGKYRTNLQIEVPDATVAEWKRVAAEYDRIQEEMEAAVEADVKARRKAAGIVVTEV
jgi:hypothetical protein